MSQVGSIYVFVPNTIIRSAYVNQNFSDIRTAYNAHDVATGDVHGITAPSVIMGTAEVQSVTGAKTFAINTLKVAGAGAGIATINNANTANSQTCTVPYLGASATFVMTTTGTGSAATKIAVTDDNSTAANMYPVWVTANTGDLPCYVSSTELVFNPKNAGYANASTLSVDRFIGALTGNVTGNVTGNLTGNVTGNCSGNAGTVTNGFYTTSSFNLGTTSIAVNRASAPQSLTGINIDGSSGSCTGNAATATTATTATDATNAINVREVDGSTYSQKPLAKAWASFHFSVITPGSIYGVVIDDSYGISGISVVDVAGLSAHLDVTFTTSFSNTVYCVFGSSSILISDEATANDKRQSWTWHPISRSTNHCTISSIGHYSEWSAAGSHKAGTLPMIYTNSPFSAGTGDGCIVFFGV